MSITGFDDVGLAAPVDPALTTVQIPSEEMGRKAAEYLITRLRGSIAADKTRLESSLVVRNTAASPQKSAV